MLQKLREKTSGWIATVILGLLIVPFAFFGVESYMSQRVETYVARIAQPPTWWPSAPRVWPLTYLWSIHDIDQQAYRERVESVRANFRQQQGDNFDPKAFEAMENKRRILDALIDEQLMKLTAERDGIAISDDEVRKAIQQIPDFQVDGAFNPDRYRLLLASQNPPLAPRDFEARIRDSLKNAMIPEAIARSVLVTDFELDRLMRLLGEHRDIGFVVLPAPAVDTAEVTPAQIDAWYKAHKNDYRRPETIRLEYVEVDGATLTVPPVDEAALRKRYQEQIAKYSSAEKREISHILVAVAANASAAERKAAEARARKLAADAQAPGADFAALARASSDDAGSKANGGDLGWIGKGVMPGTFDQTAFAMQAGEVRGPVKTDFGWHVIKVNQIRPAVQRPFEEVRAELEKELQEGARERAFNELTGKLVDAAYKTPTSLEPAAKAVGLPLQTTPAFSRAGGPGIAGEQKVLRVAFSEAMLQDGTASDPIELGPERTVLVRVIDHVPEQALPLVQVRDAVVAAIRADRQRKAAEAAADALVKAARTQGLAAAAAASGMAVAEVNDLRRNMPVPSPQAAEAFFNAPRPQPGQESVGKILVNGQYMVFAVRAVRDGDIGQVSPQERETLRRQLADAYGMQAQDAFVRAVRAKYDIQVAEDRL